MPIFLFFEEVEVSGDLEEGGELGGSEGHKDNG